MSFIDQGHRAAVAAAQQRELDKAYQLAVGERTRRDADEVIRTLSRTFRADVEEFRARWVTDQDVPLRLVDTGGKAPTWIVGDAPAGAKMLQETSFLEAVQRGVDRKQQSRAYFTTRSGRSEGLPTQDLAIHALDVQAARERVSAIEQWIDKAAVPAGLKARLESVKMDPVLRQQVTKAIDAADPDGLLNEIIVTRRVLRGPDGRMREHTEARRWDPDTWPRIAEEERPPGLTQATVAELGQRQRIVETAKARWGPEVVEGGDMPAHWREI